MDGSLKKRENRRVLGVDMPRGCENQKGSGRWKEAGYGIKGSLGLREDAGCRSVGAERRLGRPDAESGRPDEIST